MIAGVPRQSLVLVGNKVHPDWDRWFQSLAKAMNTLSVTTQGAFADPNGNVVASPGAIYTAAAGGANVTLWVKESGVETNTGWTAK